MSADPHARRQRHADVRQARRTAARRRYRAERCIALMRAGRVEVAYPRLTRQVQQWAVPRFGLGPYHRDVAEPLNPLVWRWGHRRETSVLGWGCPFYFCRKAVVLSFSAVPVEIACPVCKCHNEGDVDVHRR